MTKTIRSYAKINLFLKILGKKNNYHRLYSLITLINLHDKISITENNLGKDMCKFSNNLKVKKNSNTLLLLLELMKKNFKQIKEKNFSIYIKKNIPSGSGMGGASSNATALFFFLKKKFKLKISKKETIKILSQVGKDCPLFVNKNLKLVSSFGEKFKEYTKKLNLQMLIIFPNKNLSTKRVFKEFSKKPITNKKKVFRFRDKDKLFKTLSFYGNDLIKPAARLFPSLNSLIKLIESIDNTYYYSMTGSGSAFFVIAKNKKSLLNVKKIIKKHKLKFWTTLTKTL